MLLEPTVKAPAGAKACTRARVPTTGFEKLGIVSAGSVDAKLGAVGRKEF